MTEEHQGQSRRKSLLRAAQMPSEGGKNDTGPCGGDNAIRRLAANEEKFLTSNSSSPSPIIILLLPHSYAWTSGGSYGGRKFLMMMMFITIFAGD